jgi:hypothetical protein
MLVRVFELQEGAIDKEIGMLRLEDGHVIPSSDDVLLLQILSYPAAGPATDWEPVTAKGDPEKFLENLRFRYHGAYLRVSAPEETNGKSDGDGL